MVERTGYGAYVFFAVFCLLSLVWTYFFVPETMGKTYVVLFLDTLEHPANVCDNRLEQMDQVFNDRSSEAEKAKRERVTRDILARGQPLAAA